MFTIVSPSGCLFPRDDDSTAAGWRTEGGHEGSPGWAVPPNAAYWRLYLSLQFRPGTAASLAGITASAHMPSFLDRRDAESSTLVTARRRNINTCSELPFPSFGQASLSCNIIEGLAPSNIDILNIDRTRRIEGRGVQSGGLDLWMTTPFGTSNDGLAVG
jgi:hypothetical protein